MEGRSIMASGHINIEDEFGRLIHDLVISLKPKCIVEIGTWDGTGSTLCIINAILEAELKGVWFGSIEIDTEIWEKAKINLNKYLLNPSLNINLLNGAIISYADISWLGKDIASNIRRRYQKRYREMFVHDTECLKTAKNILPAIPDHIDILILDGGLYTTYPEWVKIKDRVEVVILDDTKTLKTQRIREELLADKTYKVIFDNLNIRRGVSAFCKI